MRLNSFIKCFKSSNKVNNDQRNWSAKGASTCDEMEILSEAPRGVRSKLTTTNNYHNQNRCRHSRRHSSAWPLSVSATIFTGLICVSLTLIIFTNSAKATQNSTSPSGTSNSSLASPARRLNKSVSGSDPKASGVKSPVQSQFEQQQSSELSSTYVQIPIAEPIDALANSNSDVQQQQQAAEDGGDSSADSTKATTWTGPYPKKFHIGYIKQSDLHQVLMESLKNDPFLGSKKPPPATAKVVNQSGGKTSAASSTTSSLPTSTQPTARPSLSASTKSQSHQNDRVQEPQLDDSLASPVAPQQQLAPPSDASSLMQSGPYSKLAIQQNAANKHHHLKHHQNHPGQQQHFLQQQQQQRPSHQQAAQPFQWPSSSSHGRLVSPQVQARPSALGYLGKGNMYQANNMLMLLQQQQQQQQRHPHHYHQQRPTNPNHQGAYRNAPASGRHSNRQQASGYQTFSNSPMGQQSFKFNAAPMVQQLPAAFQQPPQFQLAESPQSFTNQPVYTVNNFPASQQQQLIQQQQQQTAVDSDQMELIQLTNGPANGRQKTKSDYYLSSWRPVQSAAGGGGEEVPKQQQLTTSEIVADGFDEDLGAPATGGNGNSMNRHPVLSNFLQNGGNVLADKSESNGKTSSSKKVKPQTKTTSNANGGTKGASKGFDADSVQQRQEAPNGTKSDTSRRAAAGNSNSTTTPSSVESNNSTTTSTAALGGDASTTTMSAPTESSTTTMSSVEQTNTTPLTTTTSATNTQTNTTMAPSAGETTTEPDSEVFESDSTEPSTDEEVTTTTSAPTTTTTSSSMMQASNGRSNAPTPSLQSPSSSTAPSVQQQQGSEAGGESEVATQSQQSSGQFPGLSQSVDEQQQTITSTAQNSVQASTPSTSREETTPRPMNEVEGSLPSSSSTQSSLGPSTDSSSASTGTDATMSDEALMAAAVRASELTKSSRSQLSNSKRPTKLVSQNETQGGTKKARSSERILQQPAGGASTKGLSQQQQRQASKLITKKPNAGQRASKQISGVKGAAAKGAHASGAKSAAQKVVKKKSAPSKLLATSAAKVTAGNSASKSAAATSAKSNKFTRMAPASLGQQASNSSLQTQMVSMTAAQAQSAAQTLASLLLSRCLSSNNCAHLLDVCSTKQAAVPFGAATNLNNQTTQELSSINGTISSSSAWSMPVGLMSSNLMSLMQALQADKALQLFPAWRETIENIMDQEAPAGYTLIMPSNEAIDRMALSQVDNLLANGDQMSQLIDNHILDSALTIDLAPSRQSTTTLATQRARHQTRHIKSKGLQINQHRDRMVTINGKRVVYANQPASGGRIHVIDGLLDWPGQALDHATASRTGELATTSANSNNRLLDIMDTLRQCDKFDGFVTLAEGTGLTQILKQDEPLTVFVPSNEALRKIPDEELEVIKNNSTALREFIMYHIVNGSYFSQDLRDGQQLASILDMRPIQVGVRVDGCSRRLVEANTSPMRRPDIVAKNGVIHILDWYLTTRDNEWCDPIGRSAAIGSGATTATSASNQQDSVASGSERVQQLASEQVAASVLISNPSQSGTSIGYATRMTSLPANHKPAPATIAGNDMDAATSLVQPTKSTGEQQQAAVASSPPNSVIIEHVQ